MNEVILKGGDIAAYNPFRAQLRELAEDNEKAIFDYEDPAGNKAARSHVYKLRQTKSAVDKVRKDEKQEALEYGRKVDAEAKEIIGEIEEMIQRHQQPLDEIEQREKDRVAALEGRMLEIVDDGNRCAAEWMNLRASVMTQVLADIESVPVTEDRWQEFVALAAQKKDMAVKQIREAIAKREKYDAEQAELEKLRKEAVEREQREHEERIAREAEERARKQAEETQRKAQQEAEAKSKAEAEAAERRELQLRLEKEQAERERIEAEQRAERAAEEAQRQAQAEAEAKQRREREEAEKREANKRHRGKVNREAKAALVAGGLSEDDAQTAIELIAKKEVPHVSIVY